MELPNISGSRPVNNNIFFNGKVPSDDNGVPYNFISCCNMLDIDPLFTEVPLEVNGAIDIRQTNMEKPKVIVEKGVLYLTHKGDIIPAQVSLRLEDDCDDTLPVATVSFGFSMFVFVFIL